MIQEVAFAELSLWDVKRIFSNEIESVYPIVSLGSYISQRNEKVKLFDYPNEEFQILGVNNIEGLFDAYIEKGKNINQPYKKVEIGDLAYNPYRVNVGSIGKRYKELKHQYISPAYIVFETLKNLNSEYLYIAFKTTKFNQLINENTTGSVRQNLKYDVLAEIKIPLPPLAEQNRLVADYQSKIQKAEQQEAQAQKLEEEIEIYLLDRLGIEKLEAVESSLGLQMVRFTNLDRWDVRYLSGNIPTINSKYSIEKFEKIIHRFNKSPNGKSIRINSKDFPNDTFHYIGMENLEKNTGKLIELREVFGSEIKSQTLRVPQGYFLYGKLRPYLNKYWFNESGLKDIICSSEFFVFTISEYVNNLYFKYVLSSNLIQSQITDKTSGARMPRINESTFFNLQFPLPPIEIQQEIAEHISALKHDIQELKNEAEQNRTAAIADFESQIFKAH